MRFIFIITTVIAACGIVTLSDLLNSPYSILITTVIAACGIVTLSIIKHNAEMYAIITTVIAACGIVTGGSFLK